ncbi:MAG: SulP family inorganic anion transporter [Chloroflexi bacterium]|nr:SulP family inorganic anion transporter [Chloroflexota bacterium]
MRGDLFGGVTATIVALPVALAFGVASGLGPEAGIYSAIAVGFFAAVFGGTPSQISGPTGPMTVAMAVVVAQYATNAVEAFTVVMLGGLFQILLGLMRIGRFVSYTPYSVISGFMTGIGVIVIIIQVLPFLGIKSVPGGPVAVIQAWPGLLGDYNLDALIIAVVALVIGFAWRGLPARYVPGPLVALVVGSLMGVFWLGGAPTIGQIPTGLPSVQIPHVAPDFLIRVIQPAIILALLGSIDSLLTSLIADSITRTRHKPNKELVGQGIGNMMSGFIGGLPGAGATLGTVVSIRAGGRTPVAGVLRSVVLVALILGLGWLVERIPLAVLAAILMKVGWDIIDWKFVTRIHRVRKDHLMVMLVTFGLTVFLDLVTAVAIGLIAAGFAHARRLETLEVDNVVSAPLLDMDFLGVAPPADDEDQQLDRFSARVGLVGFRGQFSVASSNRLVQAIGPDIKDHEIVILDFSRTTYVDDSAALLMERVISTAEDEGTTCIVMGLAEPVASTLNSLNIFGSVPEDHFVDNLDEARELAREMLED